MTNRWEASGGRCNEKDPSVVCLGLEYHPYVTSHRPSWCDRIFFYAKDGASSSNNKLQITKYDAEFKCILSDHKPVYVKVLAEVGLCFVNKLSQNK